MTHATTQAAAGRDTRQQAIDNLLVDCARIVPGRKVLFVNETGKAHVDPATIARIEQRAAELGAQVRSLWTGHASGPESIPADVLQAIEAADVSILNHGIGGMLRLRAVPGKGVGILNYATNDAVLGSPWTLVPYTLWDEISRAIGATLGNAREWRITCPHGTDLRGSVPEAERGLSAAPTGFSLLTFPLGTHRPIGSADASGTLAIRWLVSSANHDVGPGLKLEQVIHARVEAGRIVGFDGPREQVAQARAYLEKIGSEHDVDPYIVNSWHAGTNPLAFSPSPDHADLNAWQILTHNNPRTAHFHAVGARMPGELSLPVLDPTIRFDGEVYWEAGQFKLLEQPAIRAILAGHPTGADAFRLNREIGV